jgi:asparagine synthase (glutamine-hydrolysing)
MSAIGGVFYFEPRECDLDLLEHLDRRLAHLGPDGGRILHGTSVGFVHRAFHTTVESRHEAQPFESDGLVVCFDGRLDNRGDLAHALGLVPAASADVALVAAGYRRWGRECFHRLHGDFAIVIWDARARALLLVRDPFGICRLFYHADRRRIAWASTPDALLDLPGVPGDIDDEYVGGYLTLCPEASRSAFKAIAPVAPGRGVVARNEFLTTFTHWDLRHVPAGDDRQQPPDETVEQFRILFADAVRARLRADRPVIAELSGGLDSSSIVCVADAVAAGSGGAIPHVISLSRTYDRGNKGEDGYYIRAVEKQRNRPGIHITQEEDPVLGPWPDPEFLAFPRRYLCSGGTIAKGRAIQQAGARVVLSGFLGDELLSQKIAPREAAYLLRRGRWLRAFGLCREFSVRRQIPAVSLFGAYAIRPNLPITLRRSQYPLPRWIDGEFARRLDLNTRVKQRAEGPLPRALAVSRFRAPDLLLGLDHLAAEGTTAPTRHVCVEMRYPYAHRPLVEFLLSLPPSAIHGAEKPRWLQRAALADVLPEAVRTRTGKAGPGEVIARAIDREWDRLRAIVCDGRAAARGYIVAEPLLAELTRWRHGLVNSFGDVLKVIALEMWLEGLESRQRSSGVSRSVTAHAPAPVGVAAPLSIAPVGIGSSYARSS